MPAITKRTVDAAEPGARDAFLWDDKLKGFGLKVTPAGAKVYLCQYRTGGRGTPTKRVTIGRHGALTPDQARNRAKAMLGAVAEGRDPAGEKRAKRQELAAPKNTVQAVAEDWLKRDQAGKRNLPEVRRLLDHNILPAFGTRPIAEVRKRDIIALLDAIVDRGSPISANRTLACIKRLFRWAASRDVIEADPAAHVLKPGTETKRDRVLSDSELIEVWRACEAIGFPFGEGVRLSILTLARRSEIFGLSEKEVDLEAAEIRLPAERVKIKEGRTIPLSARALQIMRGLPRIGLGGYLLSLDGTKPYSNFGWAKADLDRRILETRQAPMPGWRIHDLRRTGATGLQRLGFPLQVVETALGHVAGSRAGVVGVYQKHRFADETRAALEAWGRHVEALLSGEKDNVVPMTGRR